MRVLLFRCDSVRLACLCGMVAMLGCQDLRIPGSPQSESAPPQTQSLSSADPAQDPAAKTAKSEGSPGGVVNSSLEPGQPIAPLSPADRWKQFAELPSSERTDEHLRALAATDSLADSVIELDLQSARITRSGLETLVHFPKLQKLNLASCPLIGVDWEPIAKLTQLEWLSAASSGLTDDSLQFLAPLTQLKHLNMADTQITDHAFRHLVTLSELEELDVTGCRLSGACLEAFGPQGARAKLKSVLATHTQLGYHGFSHLEHQRQLEVLSASACDAGDVVVQSLKGLNQMRVLHLSGNSLSDAGLKFLTGMKQLEELQLADSPAVSDVTLQRIKSLGKLRVLDLTSTSCTPEGVQTWKRSVPDCQVLLDGMTY